MTLTIPWRKNSCNRRINKKKRCISWRQRARCPSKAEEAGISMAIATARCRKVTRARHAALFVAAASLFALSISGEGTRKEIRMEIAPGGAVSIVNYGGSVHLRSAAGHQVLLAYTTSSDNVEVDHESTADKQRIEIRTHVTREPKPASSETQVAYEISVPPGVSVTVSTATAPITVDGLNGDITLSSDTGQITVSDVARSHVHVRGIAAPVNLNNVSLSHVDIAANSGGVRLVNVTGPKVSVGTASGDISFKGDCSGVGDYLLTTHSGNIDLMLPQTASVDLSARSVKGPVENDFPLKKKAHTAFVPKAGSSFAGTSNSGSSSVELQSFSGRIRVKKQ
jgi:hypothetical protein